MYYFNLLKIKLNLKIKANDYLCNVVKIYLKQVWQGPLSNGSFVVIVVNRFDEEKSINMDWAEDAKIPISTNGSNRFELQNLWNGELLGQIVVGEDVWSGVLRSHQNEAFKLIPVM